LPNIRLLPGDIRELIAAGEVVERPASVVKELCENAIDAGASSVEVEIRRSGLELIRVSDNGCGIEREDIPTACLRYATSKTSTVSDLDAIGTLGFRGEALAAICAVSRMRVVSRTKDAPGASEFTIEGSVPGVLRDAGAPQGTSVYVNDLFFNVPARLKFLKKDAWEASVVQQAVETLALSRPDVAFRLVRDGKPVFSSPGGGDLYSAVWSVFPRDVADRMIPVDLPGSRVKVTGFVSSPETSRASRSLQYLFVNGRSFRSNAVAGAAAEGCRNLLMHGKYPAFALFIELPLADVDVNVHPAKTEVRFKNDREVQSAVHAAVRLAVTAHTGDFAAMAAGRKEPEPERVPVPDREEAARPQEIRAAVREETREAVRLEAPPSAGLPAAEPLEEIRTVPAPPAPSDSFPQRRLEAPRARSRVSLDIEYTDPEPDSEEAPVYSLFYSKKPEALLPKVKGELFDTYIVAEYGERALFIDKHAAHERLLFEMIRQTGYADDRQLLLEPVVVSLTAREKQALLEHEREILAVGFLIEDFGQSAVAVREVPTWFSHAGIADAVTAFAQQIESGSPQLTTEETEWLLHSSACRAAIKAGHHTSERELVELANRIVSEEIPKFCPHGRPVFFLMDRKEIEKRFGRI